LAIFAIGLYATPDALADTTVSMVAGSSVPGCEELECFSPTTITIVTGESVTWVNDDTMMHFATSGIAPTPDGIFDSGMVNAGESWSYTFDEPGTYDYYCMVHAWMVGTVIVDEVASMAEIVELSVDKPSYNIGDTITINGIVSDDELGAHPVVLKILNPKGSLVIVFSTLPDAQGNFSSEAKAIGPLWKDGAYSVITSYRDKTLSTSFSYSSTPSGYVVYNAVGSAVPGCEETTDGCFIPSTITINPGESVTFVNDDASPHTTTSGTAIGGPDDVWDSSLMMSGEIYITPALSEGTYPYYCMVHAWMQGTVIVEVEPAPVVEPTPEPEAEPVQETVLEPTISISADEESYQVGDTIFVTGNVGNYIGGDWVTAELVAPNGNIAQVEQLTPNSEGDFDTTFKISLKTNGIYKIKAWFGSAETSTTFLVGSAERALVPLASVNEKMEITMDFANDSNDSQPFAFIVQIKDENNLVISMSNITGILGAGQTLDQVLSYIPTEPGTYTIEKFLWSNLNNPTALIDEKETFTFIASDLGITISVP